MSSPLAGPSGSAGARVAILASFTRRPRPERCQKRHHGYADYCVAPLSVLPRRRRLPAVEGVRSGSLARALPYCTSGRCPQYHDPTPHCSAAHWHVAAAAFLGKAQAEAQPSICAPGPKYNVDAANRTQRSPTHVIGTSQRPPLNPGQKGPGPGIAS